MTNIEKAKSNMESVKTGVEVALTALGANTGSDEAKTEAALVGIELAEECIRYAKEALHDRR